MHIALHLIYQDVLYTNIWRQLSFNSQSQWQRGLRLASVAVRLLGLRVRNPPGAWKSVSCECCV